MITFKEVDKDNYLKVANLDVHKEQEDFVAANWYSLLEVHYEEEEHIPLAIYSDDQLVGFLMYAYFPADDAYPVDSWWILRLMMDKEFQGKGYGREAVNLFLEQFKKEKPGEPIRLGAEPENARAIKFYQSLGFKEEGLAEGETVFVKEKL